MFLPLGDDIDKRSLPAAGILIVVANVLAYAYEVRLWTESLPSGQAWLDFIRTWGLVPAVFARGQYIGLFTSMFLHGDVVHLLGNMLMLWAFVGTLERGLGSVLFVLLYILWGLVAGVAHAVMNWGQGIPMIGASGAISGVIGAYVVTFGALTNIRTLVWFFGPRQINVPAGAFVFIWVMSQLSGMQEASAAGGGGIAWYAHAGGFVAGATTMLIFSREVKSRLVLNREGKIQFVDREDITEEPEGAEGLEHAVPSCVYCGFNLPEENRLQEDLYRCPNQRCGRLVYLNSVLTG